ncbi:MAG: DUF2157 domain-containing protein [Gemmatimonadales bacterium]|nr:DUF2157 domain-containing protein [Gemmatimonadales bacterium]
MARSRRDAIDAFGEELARLEAEGVLVLRQVERERVAAHHASLRTAQDESEAPDTPTVRRLAAGMRIATLLGAFALSAAYALFVDANWAALSLTAQLPLVMAPPIVLAILTGVAAQREPSRYVASVVATVAVIAFAVNLIVVGSLFNLPESRHAFLAVGLFAMALAYGYRLALVLVLGILGVGLWFWSLASIPSGAWWSTAFEQLEPLALTGLVAIVLSRRLAGSAPFADEYRVMGSLALAGALLILGQTANASYFHGADGRIVEGAYQVVGAMTFAAMIAVGLRRDWPEMVRVGTGAAFIFLVMRLVDWFWDWIPKWLFFLVIGAVAMGVVLLLRRLRLRQAVQA